MVKDLCDPGPDFNGQPAYLNWPRNADGEPCFSDTHSAADVVFPQAGSQPAPRNKFDRRRNPQHDGGPFGEPEWRLDLTHRGPNGSPISPPVIPLDVLRVMHANYYG